MQPGSVKLNVKYNDDDNDRKRTDIIEEEECYLDP
jgi:hypothetical protein